MEAARYLIELSNNIYKPDPHGNKKRVEKITAKRSPFIATRLRDLHAANRRSLILSRFEPSDQLRYSAVQVSLKLPRRFSIDAAGAPPVHEPPCLPEKFRRKRVG